VVCSQEDNGYRKVIMKKNITNLILGMIAVVLLGSCSTKKEDMGKEGQECTPILNILSSVQSVGKKSTGYLIYDETDKKEKGIVTWISDKVTSMVRTASLKIYLKIALNVDFRFTVAIMMTMAVILFTASVILGLTQANGYNALMFLLKLIIIYNLTINYYYFDIYVIEAFEGLISDTMMFTAFTFSDYVSMSQQQLCFGILGAACNPVEILSSVFGLQAITDLLNLLGIPLNAGNGAVPNIARLTLFGAMDQTLSKFFNFDYWKLIMAVSTMGSTGIFWAGSMAALIIAYFTAIIVTVKTYLMATIARFVLYGLGPIFISFALFNQTRSLFDGWLKQLISFTLQPVFLFMFLGMFHTILNGFSEKMYTTIGAYSQDMALWCPTKAVVGQAAPTGCSERDCSNPGNGHCVGAPGATTGKEWLVTSPVEQYKGLCVGWGALDTKSDLNWYKLCKDKNCTETSNIDPVIPIDIWTLISAILVCFIMVGMCHWVVQIANTLADGVVTLSDTKIQGWDRLKHQVTGGIGKGIGSIARGGTTHNKPGGR
jgi:type IV secretory pathway VirB6-like protein